VEVVKTVFVPVPKPKEEAVGQLVGIEISLEVLHIPEELLHFVISTSLVPLLSFHVA
jgi:hypothetical protein